MNHILNHKGYRFFQASFDPDEKGTILSVNKDFFGTLVTYIGYILLYIGLVAIMLYGKTRFKDLSVRLDKLKSKRANLSVCLLFFSTAVLGQADYTHDGDNFSMDPTIKNYVVDVDDDNEGLLDT